MLTSFISLFILIQVSLSFPFLLENNNNALCNTIYKCNDDPSSDTCHSITKKEDVTEVSWKECPLGKECPGKGENDKCQDASAKLPPGLYCTNSTQCDSGVCTNNTCIGKNESEECSIDLDCHINLFCNQENKKCTPLLKIGEQCTNDYQCAVNSICHNQKCTEIMSVNDGEEVEEFLLCKSLRVVRSGDKYKCLSTTLKNKEIECAADQESCSYTFSYGEQKEDVDVPCQCTYASTDLRICTPPSDSQEVLEGKQVFKKHFEEVAPRLHTSIRGMFFEKDEMIAIFKVIQYNKIYKLSDCVLDSLLHQNNKLPPLPSSGFYASFNKMLLLFLVLLL